MVNSGVMNGVDVRTPKERMTDIECRALYNKIVCKLTNANFHTTPKDKAMLEKLRECELYLRELSLYSDLIYQRQVKDGNDENDAVLKARVDLVSAAHQALPSWSANVLHIVLI